MDAQRRRKGIQAALTSAMFLGLAPVFGKLSILYGFSPLAVTAFRTALAALMLLVIMAFFQRPYFYIYPVGLAGCLLAGFINGVGSIFYYTALSRLDAGVGHLLYSFYPLFIGMWLLLESQPITNLTKVRLMLSIPAVFLIMQAGTHTVDLTGAGLMLASSILYALHLMINQRILYEVPAPTVTLYTLLSMSVTVGLAYLVFDRFIPPAGVPWWPVVLLALITFVSRILLFLGVKHLGGMQTALLGLGELLIAIVLSQAFLGDRLSLTQWLGASLLALTLFLVGFDRFAPEKKRPDGWLSWLNPPQPRFPVGDEFPAFKLRLNGESLPGEQHSQENTLHVGD
jgi:drug/metabolite transporter (DMT)-like permease